MSYMLIRYLIVILLLCISSTVNAQTVIDSVGWENTTTGCSLSILTDGTNYGDDYAPANACTSGPGSTPVCEVTSADKNSGSNSFKTSFYSGFGSNGPDCIIGDFLPGGNRGGTNTTYFRWYQKFSTGFRFHADHKMVIAGAAISAGSITQDIYFNTRSNGGETNGKLMLGITIGDTGHESNNITVTPNVWHLFEASVRCGGGSTPVVWKMDGVTATFDQALPTSDVCHALGIGYAKHDTTFNGYDDAGVQAATPFYEWFDDFCISADTWCAAPDGGGGGGGSGTLPTRIRRLKR